MTDKERAYDKSYKKAHSEQISARSSEYRKRPEVKKRTRAYYESKREKVLAYEKNRSLKPEVKKQRKTYYQKPATKERVRKYFLKTKYGITPEEFYTILAGQGGVCAVCGTCDWGKKGPCVDHNHANGGIRGVLCSCCNSALGLIKENESTAQSMINYLLRHK